VQRAAAAAVERRDALAFYSGVRSEWWVWHAGVFRKFLGGESRHVVFLASDGDTLVWNEGSLPYATETGIAYRRYDLYKAPFTTDPDRLEPELLVPGTPPGIAWPELQNGWLSAAYLAAVQPNPREPAVFLARVADGLALRTPDRPPPAADGSWAGYSWGFPFTSATELWAGISPRNDATDSTTIARIRYEALTPWVPLLDEGS
jgi:hypothetical protein